MKTKGAKMFALVLAFILFLIFCLFLVRAFSERDLDDVSPEMECKKNLFEEADVLWVIPEFDGKPISENKTWCAEILSFNKKIGMHGVTHSFREFNTDRNQSYLDEGIKIFEECFGYKPTMFKPPQVKISEKNEALIKENGMVLKSLPHQITHKAYHCGEYGDKRNWLISLF